LIINCHRNCWCHKVWYHVTMMIVSMMVWFLIDYEEELRVAHLTTYTRLALSRSLRESLGSFAFWVIHCLRLLRHSFTSYSNNHYHLSDHHFRLRLRLRLRLVGVTLIVFSRQIGCGVVMWASWLSVSSGGFLSRKWLSQGGFWLVWLPTDWLTSWLADYWLIRTD
jgi:hypothetical protein